MSFSSSRIHGIIPRGRWKLRELYLEVGSVSWPFPYWLNCLKRLLWHRQIFACNFQASSLSDSYLDVFLYTSNWTTLYSRLSKQQNLYKDNFVKQYIFGEPMEHFLLSSEESTSKSQQKIPERGPRWQWNTNRCWPFSSTRCAFRRSSSKNSFFLIPFHPQSPIGNLKGTTFNFNSGSRNSAFCYHGCLPGIASQRHSNSSFLPHAWLLHWVRRSSGLTTAIQHNCHTVQMALVTTWSSCAKFRSVIAKELLAISLNNVRQPAKWLQHPRRCFQSELQD